MGLVDYSDSESESETVQQKPASTPSAPAPPKKPFQKLLDRSSGSGKIVVNLSSASAAADTNPEDEQPPAKRVKTVGGSRFSSLGSFLPPPKKTGAAAPAPAPRKTGSAPAPGVHLRTAAEPAFVRGGGDVDGMGDVDCDGAATAMNFLPPSSKGPSIPEGQKPEEEVKLVGKPLMFKPLSVARKKAPAKNKKKDLPTVTASAAPSPPTLRNGPMTTAPAAATTADPPKKKISLFSMGDDEPASTASTTAAPAGAYEPIFTAAPEPAYDGDYDNEDDDVTSAYPTYQQQQPPLATSSSSAHDATFSNLADTLSPAARRELFGRSDPSALIPPNAKVITFDMEREYAHNEALRASGAQQAYNPVRSIAPGKHSLRQVVNMAQSNQSALEESFARAKSNQRDAAGRYGWK
ncbi:hypothetical protein VTI74DRAFT_10982 [Chaetomium olivicolor]